MEKLNKAVAVLEKGGVVIAPTDTVYGFLADATNKKAVEKIYKIKKRPKAKLLPVFVSSIKMARELVEVDGRAKKMLKKHWPGAYTFVLPASPAGGPNKKGGTIALRMPKDTFLLKLIKKLGRPLAQTSANLSDQEPLKSGEQIRATFGKSKLIGLIITSNKPLVDKPSKVIDLTGKKLTRIR